MTFSIPKPFRSILRPLYRAVAAPLDRRALRWLARCPHPKARLIPDALRRASESSVASAPLFARIEALRNEWLLRTDVLVDGSLGEPRLKDGRRTIADVCSVSKTPRAARLLYELVIGANAASVVELGTNLGISAAYLAEGTRRVTANGRVTTLEASPYRLRFAHRAHESLGLRNITYAEGLFADTLPVVLRAIGPFDFAFVDGHHEFEATLRYLDILWPHAASGAVFVFDDIRWSAGMRKAWQRIRRDRRFSLIVDAGTMGICVARLPDERSTYLSPRLFAAAR
jgi:predicted O-methyltransferase YrrM